MIQHNPPIQSDSHTFFDEWLACLRSHYVHVVRIQDHVTEPTLREVLLQTGLSAAEIDVLRDEALASAGLNPPLDDTPPAPDDEPADTNARDDTVIDEAVTETAADAVTQNDAAGYAEEDFAQAVDEMGAFEDAGETEDAADHDLTDDIDANFDADHDDQYGETRDELSEDEMPDDDIPGDNTSTQQLSMF